MEKKIQQLLSRLPVIEAALSAEESLNDRKKYRALTQEHAYLSSLKSTYLTLKDVEKQLAEAHDLTKMEKDPSFLQLLTEEIDRLQKTQTTLSKQLEELLIPPDPDDSRNIILELRAGTGGEEAALFVADCARMYKMFADARKWHYEVLSCTPSEMGGFKEYIMSLSGDNVYRFLKYEAGTHRIQRVPDTEAQGRIHTSAITVAVLLEPTEDAEIVIDERDLRIDTYRSSGAGGQHVNVTDSAVRITHIPTGVVVACQAERSQHKNKDKAMRWLKAELADRERNKKQEEIASTRASQVGSGDRSERIRTYNVPQNRVTDHRINLTKHNLDQILEGDLSDICEALVAYYRQQKLQ
jgi:peptide chain release factor 1